MTRFTRPITIFLLSLICSIPVFSQLTVETQVNPLALAQRILGEGVTILNPQFKGAAISAGTFQAVSGSFPLNSGIILTSGRAKTTGTNPMLRGVDGLANYNLSDNLQASTLNQTGGDGDLSNYIGDDTYDACVLEFDFIPQGDSINVRYIFGSEEYPQYTCSEYNDVFAFLITGPGFATPTNIALVPNTNIPVAINSINNGVPGGQGEIGNCTGMGGGSPFTQYYVSNNGSTIVTYNGRTVVLTAKAKVQPCQVYHIKLAIADAVDRILDSGVFIEAGSFSSKPEFKPVITGPLVDANNNIVLVEACKSAELKISRSEGTVGPFTVNITYGGNATPGVDFTPIPSVINFAAEETEKIFPISAPADAFNEGTEKFVMYFSKTLACSQELADSIVISIKDSLLTTARKDTFLCSNSSVIIKTIDPVDNTTNTYLWNDGSATQSILVSQPGTYYATHTYSQRCVNVDTFAVVNRDPTFSVDNANPAVCDGTPAVVTVTTNADTVRWNTGVTTKALTITDPGTYWVMVKNTYGCSRGDTFDVAAKPSPVLNLDDSTAICPDETITLNAFYPGATYLWNTGATSSSLAVNTTGVYYVTSTLDNCSSRDTIAVNAKKIAVANAGPDVVVMENNSIRLNATQHPDNATYAWTPSFTLSDPLIADPIATPAATTEYTVNVTSVDGCTAQDKMLVTIQYLLNIPNAFSPNGDAINDKWRIYNINRYPLCRVSIFNRYGQQMFSSVGYREPWDGTFKGSPLSPATYYYVIELEDGRRFGGWVLLLR